MPEEKKYARRVSLAVSIGGHDATGYINPCLLDFTFTDQAGGKADEVQLALHDRDGHWQNDWQPQKGTPLVASLTVHDWEVSGQSMTLPCGEFKIDELEFAGPPDKITIKALSAALTSGIRDEKQTKAWENFTLQNIAQEVAQKHSLQLMYDGENHTMARQDQREESDLAFVQRLAAERGMYCKVHDGKMVLFDGDKADGQQAGIVIPRRGAGSPKSFSFKIESTDTGYTKAQTSYTDPQTGKTHTATAQAAQASGAAQEKPKDEKILQLNARVESASEAMRLSRSALRGKNGNEQKASLELMGNPALVAGITIKLEGFGQFDGHYFIEKATHKVGGNAGYATSLEIRKTLDAAQEREANSTNIAERAR